MGNEDCNEVDIRRCENLLLQVKPIVKRYHESKLASGEYFNVFDILDRARDEVKGHSAFIAELLNPEGIHGQGRVFLDLFLDALAAKTGGSTWLATAHEATRWKVWAEKAINPISVEKGPRRIDILLESENSIIGIENKIDAGDQMAQLFDYWVYVEKRFCEIARKKSPTKEDPCLLIYLTLDGHDASPASLKSLDEKLESLDKKKVTNLDYQEFIHKWISSCIERMAMRPMIRETLVQYQKLVETLTGQGGDMQMCKNIASILKTEDDFRAAQELAKCLPYKKAEIEKLFWEKLESRLEPVAKSSWSKDDSAFVSQLKYKKDGSYPHEKKEFSGFYGLCFPFEELVDGKKLGFFVTVENYLIYCICLLDSKNHLCGPLGLEADNDARLKIIRGRLCEASNGDAAFKKGAVFLAFRYPKSGLFLKRFDKTCSPLFDENKMEKIIDEMVEEIGELLRVSKKI